jgi:hypothetical protein
MAEHLHTFGQQTGALSSTWIKLSFVLLALQARRLEIPLTTVSGVYLRTMACTGPGAMVGIPANVATEDAWIVARVDADPRAVVLREQVGGRGGVLATGWCGVISSA